MDFNTLYDLLKQGLNNKTKYEFCMYYTSVDLLIEDLDLANMATNGKKIRKERVEVMTQILKLFYLNLNKTSNNQVCPSMKTIAFYVNPNLKAINRFDPEFVVKQKSKMIHATVMRVQRAIMTLQQNGLIKIHKYFISKNHFESKKAPCYFYELIIPERLIHKCEKEKKINIQKEYDQLVKEQEMLENTKGKITFNNFVDVMKDFRLKKKE